VVHALAVFIHEQRVGTLVQTDGRVALRVDPAWRARPDRFVLSASYEQDGNADPRPCLGLPPFFANLLFEGRLREWVERSEGLGGSPLELLARLGRDLPGAVQLHPVDADFEPVADGADLGGGPSGTPKTGGLRWSLAGVQLKLSLAPAGERFTVPVHGKRGCYIGKFADRVYAGVPEIEHATMSWARACGLRVADTELRSVSDIDELPFEMTDPGEAVLLVRRFDRTVDGAGAVHAEEFAQALNILPADKYRQFGWKHHLRLVEAVCPSDVGEYLRRLIFVILSGNGDAHHKNWGLLYPDGRRAELAPAYDQVATVVWSGADPSLLDTMPYKVQGTARYEALHLAGLCGLLDALRSPTFRDGPDEVARANAREWVRRVIDQQLSHRSVAEERGGAPIRQALDRHHARLPLLRGR
jgi:serine/threonine-protein kinase HipA